MEKNKFRQIYDALPACVVVKEAPKTQWVKRLAELCKVHPQTVRGWLAGTYTPDALRKSIISKELGVPEEELFN